MAYKEFGKQIHVENSEELVVEPDFCNQNILVAKLETEYFFIKTGLTNIKIMLNDSGTFMSFKSFKVKIWN